MTEIGGIEIERRKRKLVVNRELAIENIHTYSIQVMCAKLNSHPKEEKNSSEKPDYVCMCYKMLYSKATLIVCVPKTTVPVFLTQP